MKLIKEHITVTQWYTVEDGPIIETEPRRLSQGRFKIEKMSVTTVNGHTSRIFIRGHSVLKDGHFGKWQHDRTLFPEQLPESIREALDITLEP